MNFVSKIVNSYIPIDVALADKFCDDGSDHYCSITCNRCQESQNIIMFVGGFQRKPVRQWMLNPTFFALNGSLPSCLNSTKNNITNDGSHTRIRSPGLFINQGDILQHLVVLALNMIYLNLGGNPVMCVGHARQDDCFEYEVGSLTLSFVDLVTYSNISYDL